MVRTATAEDLAADATMTTPAKGGESLAAVVTLTRFGVGNPVVLEVIVAEWLEILKNKKSCLFPDESREHLINQSI